MEGAVGRYADGKSTEKVVRSNPGCTEHTKLSCCKVSRKLNYPKWKDLGFIAMAGHGPSMTCLYCIQ